jgi:uncharacterized membrane protein YccC
VMIVVLTALFPQDRAPFLVGLALWGAVCALVATLLRNFAAYSAALAGYTAAIIASDTLGATGGPDGQVFMLAIYRASEICLGTVCAGIVLAGTDLGDAPRRLARLFAKLSVDIMRGFSGTLASAEPELAITRPVRRELVRHRDSRGRSPRTRANTPQVRRPIAPIAGTGPPEQPVCRRSPVRRWPRGGPSRGC